jgi:hypothetical protein
MAGAWWLPVLGSVAALAARRVAWRGGLRPASLLIAAWHLMLFAGVVFAAATSPDDFRLQGDTMGINISLALVGPALFGAGAALATYVGVRTFRGSSPRAARLDPGEHPLAHRPPRVAADPVRAPANRHRRQHRGSDRGIAHDRAVAAVRPGAAPAIRGPATT